MTSSNGLQTICVIGAGSWGTALALYLARRDFVIHLWSNESDHIETMQKTRINARFLPDHPFPNTLLPEIDLATAVKNADTILIAVPSNGFHNVILQLQPLLKNHHSIVCATKGLDPESNQLLHETIKHLLGNQYPFATLSGPSFAREVAQGLPTAVVIASEQPSFSKKCVSIFNSPIFRTYVTTDVIGVEIGGIVKNVLAIATGISDGMSLGSNSRSALITRGLAEMIRLGIALGGQLDTFTGLAGIGDLVLTATDNQSRNYRFGLAIGKGTTPDVAQKEINQVIEGKQNAAQLVRLAKKYRVEMPITEMVWNILENHISLKDAVQKLLSREPKEEVITNLALRSNY